MNINIESVLSCGVVQVYDLFSAKGNKEPSKRLIDAVNTFVNGTEWSDPHGKDVPARPHFVWSDYALTGFKIDYGKLLANDLEANGYGKVVHVGPHVNRNTGHRISTYLFVPNRSFHNLLSWNQKTRRSTDNGW